MKKKSRSAAASPWIISFFLASCAIAKIEKIYTDDTKPLEFESTCFGSQENFSLYQNNLSNWELAEKNHLGSKIALKNHDGKSIQIFDMHSMCLIKVSSPHSIDAIKNIPLGLSKISSTNLYSKQRSKRSQLQEICTSQSRDISTSLSATTPTNTTAEPITPCGNEITKISSAWIFKTNDVSYSIYSIGSNFFIWRE